MYVGLFNSGREKPHRQGITNDESEASGDDAISIEAIKEGGDTALITICCINVSIKKYSISMVKRSDRIVAQKRRHNKAKKTRPICLLSHLCKYIIN